MEEPYIDLGTIEIPVTMSKWEAEYLERFCRLCRLPKPQDILSMILDFARKPLTLQKENKRLILTRSSINKNVTFDITRRRSILPHQAITEMRFTIILEDYHRLMMLRELIPLVDLAGSEDVEGEIIGTAASLFMEFSTDVVFNEWRPLIHDDGSHYPLTPDYFAP